MMKGIDRFNVFKSSLPGRAVPFRLMRISRPRLNTPVCYRGRRAREVTWHLSKYRTTRHSWSELNSTVHRPPTTIRPPNRPFGDKSTDIKR
ncbi:hypothetical protein EYF80_041902 [Liparis tanakae]|uniref:Uncharacterized protein n=1 Tax=Liparis tanakae TaxID=230148 RepID=A0A4Z2G3K0_9TELE|nr:hypothetical protein EYF80_041902 [Liparis tanakae]